MQLELEWKEVSKCCCTQLCYGPYVFGEVSFTGSNMYIAIAVGCPGGDRYLGESFFLEDAKVFVETYLVGLAFDVD